MQNKNLQIKNFDAKNKKGGTAFFLPSSSSSLPIPPAPRPPESRRQERALQQDGEEAPTHTTREGAALPPAAAPATTPGPQPKPGPEPPPAGPRRLIEGGVVPWIAPPTARAHVAWVGVRRWKQASSPYPLSRLAPPGFAASYRLNGVACLGHLRRDLSCRENGNPKASVSWDSGDTDHRKLRSDP